MASRFTRTFWAETAERALKTFAQTALALLVAYQTLDPDGGRGGEWVLSIDWKGAALAALFAAVLSVLTSIVSGASPLGAQGSPSLVETSGRHAV